MENKNFFFICTVTVEQFPNSLSKQIKSLASESPTKDNTYMHSHNTLHSCTYYDTLAVLSVEIYLTRSKNNDPGSQVLE